jgi:hypothetical protein
MLYSLDYTTVHCHLVAPFESANTEEEVVPCCTVRIVHENS